MEDQQAAPLPRVKRKCAMRTRVCIVCSELVMVEWTSLRDVMLRAYL